MKIGALLVLGFGEAGAAIIASNIAKVGDVGFNTQGLRI